MIIAGGLALTAAVLFAVAGPALGRRLPPALATRVLVSAAVSVAAATWAVLAIAAFTLVGQIPEIAGAGRWSAQVVHHTDPIPPLLAVLCGVLALTTAIAAVVLFIRRIATFVAVQRLCRGYPDACDNLIVLDDDQPDAFATPGLHSRIVVTTGLFEALGDQERAAAVAHERSHVIHRHAWWLLASDVTAAANPLFGPRPASSPTPSNAGPTRTPPAKSQTANW